MKPIRNKQPEHRAPQRKRIENTSFWWTGKTWHPIFFQHIANMKRLQKIWLPKNVMLDFYFSFSNLGFLLKCVWIMFAEWLLLSCTYYNITYMNVLGYLWILVNISSISSCFPNTPFHSTNTIWLKLKTLWKGCI